MDAINLPSLGVAVLALLGTVYTHWSSRKRTAAEAARAHAEAEQSISQMAIQFAGSLRKEIDQIKMHHRADMAELNQRIADLEERNFMYRKYIGMLLSQLQGASIVPVATPEPWPDQPGV